MEKDIPKYFIVVKDDSKEFRDYIKWFNNRYKVNYSGTMGGYYGFDSRAIGYILSRSFRNNPQVFTAKEFMELLNKPEEETLPENWIVEFENRKTDCEFKQEFVNWANIKYPKNPLLIWGTNKLYHGTKEKLYGELYDKKTSNFKFYKAEEFINKFVKKTMKEEKEIIGYKVLDEYRDAYIKLQKMEVADDISFFIHSSITSGNKEKEEYFKKLKVLDLWFSPVYNEKEEELEVGDLVRLVELNDKLIGRIIQDNKTSIPTYLVQCPSQNGHFNKRQLKKLTKEEEQQWLTVKLPNSSYSFTVSKDYVTIEGTNYSKEYLQAALIVSKQEKSSVIIGCNAKNSLAGVTNNSHKFHLTTDVIEELLKRMI